MNITQLQQSVKEHITRSALENFGIELTNIASEVPPKIELGDLAFPIAFEMAKLIKQQTGEKQNPRAIAETIKQELESLTFIDKIEIAGPGYLNIFLNRADFLLNNMKAFVLPSLDDEPSLKVCVEHTSVNPNKAAHIGHVRNSVLGDTFVRILRASGKKVEVQNYIDNTGVQVADVVVGFIYLENKDLPAIKALDAELKEKNISFDYYCWDLYAKVGQEYALNEELKERRAEVLHLIEEGNNPTAELADYVATRNVQCILDTMERYSIRYDLLPRESEILHLQFWAKAFEQMKHLGVIRFESEGKNAGCWVMPFDEHSGTEDHESDKILVRSNGTVTYTGKDIAYQMWKLGILGLDFYYKPFHQYPDGKIVWITTAEQTEDQSGHPDFGKGETVYNVIDTRQSYPQEVVKQGVAAIAPERGESASIHLSYEMVALSPSAAEELGFKLSEEDKKRAFIEMSGRKGLGVKADELLDRLIEGAMTEVNKRHSELSEKEKELISRQIAVGALRYFLLKFTKNTLIIFDFKEALTLEGETGSFCQYAAVRANSIFRKLAENDEKLEMVESQLQNSSEINKVFNSEGGDGIWSVLMMASRLDEIIRQSAAVTEPAILAKYAFGLAKAFNLFYHNNKILPEPDPLRRAVLLSVTERVRKSMLAALSTMGIEVPEKM